MNKDFLLYMIESYGPDKAVDILAETKIVVFWSSLQPPYGGTCEGICSGIFPFECGCITITVNAAPFDLKCHDKNPYGNHYNRIITKIE